MDVYRYFIADALFMALKTKKRKKKNKRQSSNSIRGVWWVGGFKVVQTGSYVHVPNCFKGVKLFIMTIILILSMTN